MLLAFSNPYQRFAHRGLVCSVLLIGCVGSLCDFSHADEAAWSIENLAGTGSPGAEGEGGVASEAQMDNPFGVLLGPDRSVWFCEYGGQRIRRILPDGTLQTVAGTGERGYSGDGGSALHATFNMPHEIRLSASGDLYIVDMGNHCIRKIDAGTGLISTIAGTGVAGYFGDGGPAIAAQFKQPHSLQFGPDGDLYICDTGNHVIRRLDLATGILTLFAGTGTAGPTPDGAAWRGTPLNGPRSLDFDRDGNLWLATREGNQVFCFDRDSRRIQHRAGTGASGLSGDGGPAQLATLRGPKGIAIDRDGNVWLADTENHAVRRIVQTTGRMERMVGTGEIGDGPPGDPLQCKLSRPHGLFCTPDGSVLIGDSQSHRIRVLRPVVANP